MLKIAPSLLAASVAAALSACASTPHRIDTEESSPELAGRTYSDLLIIGAYEDRTFRVSAETAFAEELKARGITSAASYAVIPDIETLNSETAVRDAVSTTSHDGLLTIATLDPGYDYDYEDYMESRGLVYLLGGRPGAGTDIGSFISWAGSGAYTLHIGLWDAETLVPVWQITTDSNTTGTESGDTGALADFVVETMRERGLVR